MPETKNSGIQLTSGTPKIDSLNSSLFNISFEYAQPGDDIDGGGGAALDNVIKVLKQKYLCFLIRHLCGRAAADLGDTIS